MARPLKVLVVDDSALIRRLLTDVLDADPRIGEVRTACDPYAARDAIKAFEPDVLTLDVEMPRMDGLTFLRNLMRLRPMPVVMISSLTTAGVRTTLQALEIGAIDFIAKPTTDVSNALPLFADEIISKVVAAAGARPRAIAPAAPVAREPSGPIGFDTTDKLIAIGSSTGGTEAVRDVLDALPADSPAVVVAQHIPPGFSRSFAERLDRSSALKVREASDREPILPGNVYVAPGSHHLRVRRDGARWRCSIDQSEPVNRHRPSVDVLFDSVAATAGHNAIGVILTGMGKDGAEGLLRLRQTGAHTIAQDEASSVVWGMPGAAVQLGAAAEVLSLARIASRLVECVRARRVAVAVGAR